MDALERDYRTVLLANHEPPCLSLYQPTHRAYPDRQQNPIRFRNLIRELELALERLDFSARRDTLLAPFRQLAADSTFWTYPLDGLAAFGTATSFQVYRLQRSVRELAIVADSFHTKPLLRLLQSADDFLLLALERERVRLYEGNRYVLDEIALPAEFPQTLDTVAGAPEGEPERQERVYSRAAGVTRHGTDVRQDGMNRDTERFFRAIDAALIDYQQQGKTPVFLATLPEHQHLFRALSRNRALAPEGVNLDPSALSVEQLRARAWALVLPRYLERLAGLVDRFNAAKANGGASDGLNQIASAAAAGRVGTLLLEADRDIPGRFDSETGVTRQASPTDRSVDDLLDDLGEHVIRTGGEVVIVPKERMPTETGLAAIFRF
jgi:hypothetical protein